MTGIITAGVNSGRSKTGRKSGKTSAGMTGKRLKMIAGMTSRNGRKKNRTENARNKGGTDKS
jgi:hypothetical protein